MDEFVPATFRMDVTAEREEFFNQQEGSLERVLLPRQQRTGPTGSVFGLWDESNLRPGGGGGGGGGEVGL